MKNEDLQEMRKEYIQDITLEVSKMIAKSSKLSLEEAKKAFIICKDFRGQGIGSALINISIEWAKHKNLHGLMLETQDNNLIACKFYHNCGFKIGSVDTMLYANFENNFEKAVFWYLRF